MVTGYDSGMNALLRAGLPEGVPLQGLLGGSVVHDKRVVRSLDE